MSPVFGIDPANIRRHSPARKRARWFAARALDLLIVAAAYAGLLTVIHLINNIRF